MASLTYFCLLPMTKIISASAVVIVCDWFNEMESHETPERMQKDWRVVYSTKLILTCCLMFAFWKMVSPDLQDLPYCAVLYEVYRTIWVFRSCLHGGSLWLQHPLTISVGVNFEVASRRLHSAFIVIIASCSTWGETRADCSSRNNASANS